MGINLAASFKSTGSLSIASKPVYNFGDQDFTIMALIKTNSPGTVISKADQAGKKGWLLQVLPNVLLEFSMYDRDGSLYQSLSEAAPIFDNRWHYLTVIRNQASVRILVDGVNIPVGPNSISGEKMVGLDPDNSAPLLIGAAGYQGNIARVVLWDKALSQTDVIAAINNGIAAGETVLDWEMNQITATASANDHPETESGDISCAPAFLDLPYANQLQQQYSWCWAAVSTGISLFYNPGSEWKQCQLANQAFNQTSCCVDGSSASCNQPWELDQALSITGNYRDCARSAADFDTVKQECNNWRIVGAHITFEGLGGHFVAISGTFANQYLTIEDPWYGVSRIPYDLFKSKYQSNGTWDASYFTQPGQGGNSNAG